MVELQANITQAQIVERKVGQIRKEALDTVELLDKFDMANSTRNSSESVEVQQRVEERIRNIEALQKDLKSASAGYEAATDIERVSKEVDKFTREARYRLRGGPPQSDNKLPEETDRVAAEAKIIQEKYQKEVRASVEDAMKESKAPGPRDVEDAEQLINKARDMHQEQASRSANTDQIASRAVKLLE